jgi:hypothetical protein
VPHAPLITRAELPRYGMTAKFLAQFDVPVLEVQIAAGGALGVMTVRWRRIGEEGWTEPQVSSSRAPWSWSPPDVCGTLTFAAGTYDEGVVYTVDEAGTVTGDGGATGLTATRFDVVEDKIAAATGEAISYLGPRKELALVEWGAEIRAAVGKIVRYELKDLVGFAPTDANVADFQIKDAAREAREYLQAIGAGRINAYGMLDSSSDGKGSGLMVPILSDERAGF